MFLADTNIFLEVLLAGNKAETCKAFLDQNPGKIHLSDFSLHSIGVILFRQRKELFFKHFSRMCQLIRGSYSLANESYLKLPEIKQRFNLDFDDAYQFQVAEDHKLAIATMDKDFNRVREKLEVVPIP